MRRKRRWLNWAGLALFVAVLIVGLVGGATILRYCMRSTFSVPDANLSYQTGGTRGGVSFVVVNKSGKPATDVAVATQSFSGWTQETTTDLAGRATVLPGENEVLAVRVKGNEIRFRPEELELLSAPTCTAGLTVHVFLEE